MFENLFSERGLSLERLRALVELQEAGSIAQALPGNEGRQSQYSRQLRQLSEFFGCEVTTRRGKVLKVTAHGERLAAIAREQLRALDDFRAECRGNSVVYSIGAGDSLIHWLILPRLDQVVAKHPGTRFATINQRTNETVQHLNECRVDFGVIRKNALVTGLRSAPLGTVSFALVIPTRLISARRKPTLKDVLLEVPIAAQTSDGQFTRQCNEIAESVGADYKPALSCQTLPQTMMAVKSGGFAALLPELALKGFAEAEVRTMQDGRLRRLSRDIVLAWNPRNAGIRPRSSKLAAELEAALKV